MTGARFRARGDLEQVLRDMPGVRQGCYDIAAGPLKAAAVRRAEPHRDTGAYIAGLKPERRGEEGAALVAHADHSNYVEYGTSSRRSPDAPTPTRTPDKTGIHPQLILTGAVMDVSR